MAVEQTGTSDALTIDMDALTLGDMIDIEEYSGISLMDGFDESKVTLKLMVALVWTARRKTNPDYTLEDAKREKITALNARGNPIRPARQAAGGKAGKNGASAPR